MKHFQDLESTAVSLIESYQLFQGNPQFKKIQQLRAPHLISNMVAHHVSAAGLTSSQLPTLINHANSTPTTSKYGMRTTMKSMMVYVI